MNKFPGNFLIESPKVDFITILDTHGAIPWRDSMDLVYSMNKFPGKFPIESKFDGVILSINFQDLFSIESEEKFELSFLLLELWQGEVQLPTPTPCAIG